MEYDAFVTSVAVSAFYLSASYRFLRLHRRTRLRPELWLGLYFGLTGVYYLGLNLPTLVGKDAWPDAGGVAFEWIYVSGVFPYLFFVRSVFRPRSLWADAAVWICSVFLLVGTAIGTRAGPMEFTLDNPCFLAQWVGYTAPCAWIFAEALLLRSAAKKRMRIGLCPPVDANRYLLLTLFGGFQLLACAADLSWAADIQASESVSAASDWLLGFAEMASVGTLWLAFFPPRLYTDWITRTAKVGSTPMDG